MREGSLSSTPSLAVTVCGFFDDGRSDWGEVMPLCSFDLHFSIALFLCEKGMGLFFFFLPLGRNYREVYFS